ncbi:biotin synthesis protein [Acetobacter pasteurianus NBRC 3280]|uniref:ATP-dependent dethiobiotin synthetase BioD n=1 Tax=Acetobacter pasteurianus NBRC 3278 TaxID=1226660 RepID=A0A401X2B5_ACEPA|nr:dethiobiotin synthase [Acetobacter pasteurianus]GCD58450.1 biotin synthesis protein [Acetobacter pasteurianus NBRC 3277]GCD61940.1 biotin synthesis protein [Acetobacter pasteurianus NBRC 3278]GCD68318.1 biotin synthesis protein [Acetobacter pasteurianus NBRC 3280]
MRNSTRAARICQSFDAAEKYDQAATVQRVAARELFQRIHTCMAGKKPLRILEIGCGTGLLTEHLRACWPDADILATDFAPNMLARAKSRLGESVSYHQMDAATPDVNGPFDLICGNLIMQWLPEPAKALRTLAEILAPGGVLAVSTLLDGTFAEWQQACAQEGQHAATPVYPELANAQNWRPSAFSGGWVEQDIVQAFADGLDFVRHLKATGASTPREGSVPLSAVQLRHVALRFQQAGCAIIWRVGYACFRKPLRKGVFVTGTDTGIGKTLVSACLVRRWQGAYWKPLQSGLADEEGDTPTVKLLAGDPPCFKPAGAFLAPLSPDAAARAEGVQIDPAQLVLPQGEADKPLVVEGAGGLMVPATPDLMMIDLAQRWGLPVVLVARSGLGTLNHTLLSLEALRARQIVVAGVVLSGPLNAENRETIAQKAKVRILAEVPFCAEITPDVVSELAKLFPQWDDMCPE